MTTSNETTPRATAGDRDLLIGQAVLGGKYRIDLLLGKGGMGSVYRARHRWFHQRHVAVKVISSDADWAGARAGDRFLQEAALLNALEDTGLAQLLDGGRFPDGRPYIM